MTYYVYELIDPRCDLPFYVGKGKKNRIDAHEKEALDGKISNKCDFIRELWAEGLKVKKRKVEFFDDEREAYEFEAAHIAEIGLHNLTNIDPGGGSARIQRPFVWTPRLFARIARSANRGLQILANHGRIYVVNYDMTFAVKQMVKKMLDDLGEEFMARNLPLYTVAVEDFQDTVAQYRSMG